MIPVAVALVAATCPVIGLVLGILIRLARGERILP